ncbi:hypothetical protein L1281_000238 [Neisseria sp. HSC-16F19]|nr:hypothetical protein [Neisseria sp. HSC-16F19]MCP2039668.1 hypothetical protein [Neisseria sp. HSC-16F19]
MYIQQLDAFYPPHFLPLATLSDYHTWSQKGIRQQMLSVFPRLLDVDELVLNIDQAHPGQLLQYRQSICLFLNLLIEKQDVFYARPFSEHAALFTVAHIHFRNIMRLSEKCALNLLIPGWQIVIRGGDDLSMNILYSEAIPTDFKHIIASTDLFLL